MSSYQICGSSDRQNICTQHSVKIFLYSYIGFLLPIVRIPLSSAMAVFTDSCLLGIFAMSRRSRCDKRTLGTCLEHGLHRRKCRWPSRSHVASDWQLWEVPYGAAQLERHGKHCRDILFHVSQYSSLHTLAGYRAEICLFFVSNRSVSAPLWFVPDFVGS